MFPEARKMKTYKFGKLNLRNLAVKFKKTSNATFSKLT